MLFFLKGGWGVVKKLLKMVESLYFAGSWSKTDLFRNTAATIIQKFNKGSRNGYYRYQLIIQIKQNILVCYLVPTELYETSGVFVI